MTEDQTTTLELTSTDSQAHASANGSQPLDPANLPPGIEHIDISSPDTREHAFERYAELRARCPVTRALITSNDETSERTGLFNRPLWIVTDYDDGTRALLSRSISVDVTSVLTPEQIAEFPETPEVFKPLEKNILTVDPPEHSRLRKLVQPSFTASAIEKLRPRIQQITDELLDAAEAAAAARGERAQERTMELIADFSHPLPITVICEMLGIPAEDREQTGIWSAHLLQPQTPEGMEELGRNLGEFIEYLRALFATKREAPVDDLISQLLAVEVDGDTLTEDEILAMVFILFVAGHITTVNLIANGVFVLLKNPDQLQALRENLDLVPNAVEEILRYYGPAETTTVRYVAEDFELGGQSLSKGELMLVVLGAANHDPARFPEPERFDITREEANRHVAFGKGVHACLGAPLARLETQIALTTLLRRYPELRLGVPEREIAWAASFLRGLEGLPLRY